jgi:hypothetical protein
VSYEPSSGLSGRVFGDMTGEPGRSTHTHSPKLSLCRMAAQTVVSKPSILFRLKTNQRRPYMLPMFQALSEVDAHVLMKFSEWALGSEEKYPGCRMIADGAKFLTSPVTLAGKTQVPDVAVTIPGRGRHGTISGRSEFLAHYSITTE